VVSPSRAPADPFLNRSTKAFRNLPTKRFLAYGYYEGIPRALNLFDKYKIKVSSFMIGKAIEQAPDLAQKSSGGAMKRQRMVEYGPIPTICRVTGKRFISDCVETIHRITGQQPIG